MKKIFGAIGVLAFTTSLVSAQNQNYHSYSQLTQASSQAANGQLNMIYGGSINSGFSFSTAVNPVAAAAVPVASAASAAPVKNSQPAQSDVSKIGTPSTALGVSDNTNLWIAATIGAAALLVPTLISSFLDTN